MKHINKIFLFTVLSLCLATTGCKKYLDVNTDPNRVTDQNVTPELIFTQAENAVGARQGSGDWGFLDQWMGYFSQNEDFAPQQNVITYNIDFSFGNTLFLNHLNVLFDLHQAASKGLVSGDTVLTGASMVLSAKLWQELVDLFGNLPYTQAFQTTKYPTPAYDKAQDIYKALQLSLDSAIIYLQNVPGLTAKKAFGGADIINKGDQSKWILFANTMKLRLLIRQSEVSGFDASAEMAKIIANGGVLMAGQSISVNPGYSNDVNKQSPFYQNNGWSPTGTLTNTSNDANAYIIDQFEAGNSPDPREERFFYPAGFNAANGFVGNVFGAPSITLNKGNASSYFGPALVGTITSSNVGDGSGAKQDQWIYPSYESMFLWAEAVARGWVAGNSDAAAAYNNAMLEAFTWLGVPDPATALADYTADNPDVADFTNAGSSAESRVKFIAYQKYLSLVGVDPYEVYTDLNRLHFLTDKSYISLAASKTQLPVRLLYPQSEYTSNATNVQQQGTIDQFNSKLFWQP
ncbi:MAG TPA: SusD/RagB family nutrient-binding outer membrane lipoprotein [Puia sp.]|jgi:hypothetical protein